MRSTIFELIVNIATGAAWVAALGGAYLAFSHTLVYGLMAAVSAGILGLIPGLLVIAFLEGINLLIEIHKEQKKQTALLVQLKEHLPGEKLSDH